MYQPEPTAFIQVPTGYGMGHGLPDYTFEQTPLGLSGGGGGYGGGPGTAGAGGGGGPGTLIYTTPIFSASSSVVGPAPGPFQFHHSSSASSGTSSATTTTSPASSVLSHQQRLSPHSHSPTAVKMEQNHDDLHAQEAAARDYQPDLKGPLVGEKTPSTAITEEYAKADPIYVQKTMALPQTYSHYRPIQGDGNCGWRAIGFSYFEALIINCSKAQIDAERQRIEGLNGYIETVGGLSPFVFQDMADETIELFHRILRLVDNRDLALAELFNSFNNPDIANSILYHIRLLASSWLKGHPDAFSAFITSDLGVSGYSTETIERPNIEIDHLGMMLLVEVLLKPVGFVLQVAYLDRSVGSQVNTYRFPEEATNRHVSELGPIIHLLFRPDHYDILYPAGANPPPAPPPPAAPVDVQVHRATFTSTYEINSTPTTLHGYGATDLHTNPLALIPGGFDSLPPTLATDSPISPYAPSPASPWMSTPFVDALPQEQQAPIPLPIRTPAPPQQTHPLRFSEYCQLPEYLDNGPWKEPTFQTSTFKNSHFNVAHYNNPNFQPEEYKPEADDYETQPRVGGRKRGSV
ncbi:peptidase C65 Otubain-domain-containing protein [Podospora aff. communis PSN243]|uniref:ubiquitinyl hydrolase 1 n=1 Tax=Podospora aff. communis PSN243 TaxID=3040156 RepID=A0AAV9GJ65_9PEZI|nr:peptidase C65 Otubain-domain-containing protein [Podospora aff. communis PSN243]